MNDIKVLYIPFGKEEYKVIVKFDAQAEDITIATYGDKEKEKVDVKQGDIKKEKPAIHAILCGDNSKVSFISPKKDIKVSEVMVITVPVGSQTTVLPILDFSAAKSSQVLLTGYKAYNNDIYTEKGNIVRLDNEKISYKSFFPMFCDVIVEGSATSKNKVEIINDANVRIGVDMKKSERVVLKHTRSGEYKVNTVNGVFTLTDSDRNTAMNAHMDRMLSKLRETKREEANAIKKSVMLDELAKYIAKQKPQEARDDDNTWLDNVHTVKTMYITSTVSDTQAKQLCLDSKQPWCVVSHFEGNKFNVDDNIHRLNKHNKPISAHKIEEYDNKTLLMNVTTHYQIDDKQSGKAFSEGVKQVGEIIYKYSKYPVNAQYLVSFFVPILHFYKSIRFPGKSLSASMNSLIKYFGNALNINDKDMHNFTKEINAVFNDIKSDDLLPADKLKLLQQTCDRMKEKLSKSMEISKETIQHEPNVFTRVKHIIQTEMQNISGISEAVQGVKSTLAHAAHV